MLNTTPPPTVGNSLFQQGVSGLQGSHQAMVDAANELVRTGTVERPSLVSTDIVEPMVALQRQEHVFNANAQVVNVADQTLGALLDVNT